MSKLRFYLASVLLFLPFLTQAGTVPASQQSAHPKGHKKSQKKEAVIAPVDATPVKPGPLTPLTLAEQPASPPQISFHNGQLSIIAQNATLGEILRSVRTQTGASIDVPGNANERVVGRFGPGPSREVLSALLNGSHFNYVIVGSPANAEVLDRVVLLPKTNSIENTDNPAQAATGMPPQPANMEAEGAEDEAATEAEQQIEVPQPQPTEQPPVNGQPGVRTPEQLLQELQRQQRGGQPGQPVQGPQSFPQIQQQPEQ